MQTAVNPLEYHYETALKLDYFILGANIAVLGWTVVNTDWIPAGQGYVWLISAFWILLALSTIGGIVRQLYNGMLFGINHQSLYAAEMASGIERAVLEGGVFINQQTGEKSSGEDLKQLAKLWRGTEKKGKDVFEKLSKRATLSGNLAIILFVVALVMLAGMRISIL